VLGFQDHAAPVGHRLYFPEARVTDEKRCIEAGVPQEHIGFHRQLDVVFQLVIQVRLHGVAFGWGSADSLYSEDQRFLRSLDQIHKIFMVDIHKDQHIYLEDPDLIVPSTKSNN
jgi:hypothetical protein